MIRVGADGVRGEPLEGLAAGQTRSMSDMRFVGAQVEAQLTQNLQRRGLTPAEAAGMVDCWRSVFFEKPGRRLLLLLTPEDYDTLCPMVVRPAPTERVRLGIVLYELAWEDTTKLPGRP